MHYLLSIDGGGIRGIIAARILAEIEERTNKHICDIFKWVAGTSTGGIIALGLVKPDPRNPGQPLYKAEDFISMYLENGPIIFPEACFLPKEIQNFITPKYSSAGRHEVLAKYFGDTEIKDALTGVIITAYDLELRIPIFFIENPDNQIIGENYRKLCDGYTMYDAAMATSAAPTFFAPHKIDTIHTEKGRYTLVDGGVFANNPTNIALIEALTSEDVSLDEILVVSLGTGSLVRRYPYEQAKDWGLLAWMQPLVNVLLDAGSESVSCSLNQLLRKEQYYRFQGQLIRANDDMDDVTPQNMQQLLWLAELIIKQQDSVIDELCAKLSR